MGRMFLKSKFGERAASFRVPRLSTSSTCWRRSLWTPTSLLAPTRLRIPGGGPPSTFSMARARYGKPRRGGSLVATCKTPVAWVIPLRLRP